MKCVRLAAFGAVLSWAAVAGTLLAGAALLPLVVAIVLALGFSVLAGAHLAALVRYNAHGAEMTPPQESGGGQQISRRRVLAFTVASTLAAAAGLFRTPGRKTPAALAASAGISGRVVDQNGAGCDGIKVTVWRCPPCFVQQSPHRVPACKEAQVKFTHTAHRDNAKKGILKGDFSFTGLDAGTCYVICICGGRCAFVGANCTFTCDGPTTTVTTGADGTTAAAGAIALTDCKC